MVDDGLHGEITISDFVLGEHVMDQRPGTAANRIGTMLAAPALFQGYDVWARWERFGSQPHSRSCCHDGVDIVKISDHYEPWNCYRDAICCWLLWEAYSHAR